jgi:hypothetical protein
MSNLSDLVISKADQLGQLLAEIDLLAKQADAIKEAMKDEATSGGASVFDGALFRSTVIESNRKTVDWVSLAKAANVPADLIASRTKVTAVFSVKTTSR